MFVYSYNRFLKLQSCFIQKICLALFEQKKHNLNDFNDKLNDNNYENESQNDLNAINQLNESIQVTFYLFHISITNK